MPRGVKRQKELARKKRLDEKRSRLASRGEEREASRAASTHVDGPRCEFCGGPLVGVEGGPPPLLTDSGIVVLYNAGNSAIHGDSSLPARVYTGGQALFDPHNPIKLIARSATPFIRPTESYERTGQYSNGTTFVEGLVPFKGRWYLYYGTADSRVGVAVWDR